VAARSKAQVFGRSPAEIVGSNPTGGMDVCVVSVVCCQVEVSATDDHSSRGVLPTVARRCVWSRNLENKEAKARYRAVENTTTVGCNGRETKKNKETRKVINPKMAHN